MPDEKNQQPVSSQAPINPQPGVTKPAPSPASSGNRNPAPAPKPASEPERPKTVVVYCSANNGLVLQLHEPGQTLRTGEPVRLRSGKNTGVDAEFMDKWMKANADSDLVKSGAVSVEKE